MSGRGIALVVLLYWCAAVQAEYFPLGSSRLVGHATTVTATEADTLLDIARAHGQGYGDIHLANPHLDSWSPGAGAQVHIPALYILPEHSRAGIVLNVPEMRIYFFQTGQRRVWTYPVGIGREGWSIPFTRTRVSAKKKNPAWIPPQSIRAEYASQGEPLPARVPPGPDNPLGDYAIRLGLPSYLIHGTNKPSGIGMRVSHGCIRMYPEDVEALFPLVPVGLSVEIVNQPIKVGRRGELLFLEVHPELHEEQQPHETRVLSTLQQAEQQADGRDYRLDMELVTELLHHPRGVPVAIGILQQ